MHVVTQAASSLQAHRMPVLRHLLEAHGLTDVHQVQNVLLEAGATKANAGVEELAADARISANSVRHLVSTEPSIVHACTFCQLDLQCSRHRLIASGGRIKDLPAVLTCCTSAPVASHSAEMELTEEMR